MAWFMKLLKSFSMLWWDRSKSFGQCWSLPYSLTVDDLEGLRKMDCIFHEIVEAIFEATLRQAQVELKRFHTNAKQIGRQNMTHCHLPIVLDNT